MQTSKVKGLLAHAGKVALALLVALLIDALLSYAFCPYYSITELTWSDYRASESQSIDTLVIGSSFAEFDIAPQSIERQLASSTFNLGTLGQSMPDSLATLNTAARDHGLKRVIFCLGPETLRDSPQYDREICFMQAKSVGESLPDIAGNAARIAFDEDNFPSSKSIAWMFPWVYNTVGLSPDAVRANLQNRVSTQSPLELPKDDGSGWRYVGKGFSGYDGVQDFECDAISASTIPGTEPFDDKHVHELEQLLDACARQGARTYVVVAPLPNYVNLAQQNKKYPRLMKQLKGIAQSHGASYIDMNLTKPDVYRPSYVDFFDVQHLNLAGAERASDVLGTLVQQMEEGEDISPLFFSYDDWDTYLDSFDPIEVCMGGCRVEGDSAHVTAAAVSRPNVKVEYQFESATGEDGAFEVVQAYGRKSEAEVPIASTGTTHVRVRARVVGTTSEQDTRTFKATITR